MNTGDWTAVKCLRLKIDSQRLTYSEIALKFIQSVRKHIRKHIIFQNRAFFHVPLIIVEGFFFHKNTTL